MKPFYWLIFSIPFLLTCHKEVEDNTFTVRGVMLDGVSGARLSGRNLQAFQIWIDYSQWGGLLQISWLGSCVTDKDGYFELNFDNAQLPDVTDNMVRLGCSNSSSEYQDYARRRTGENPSQDFETVKITLDVDAQNYESSEDGIIVDNAYYTYELFPK